MDKSYTFKIFLSFLFFIFFFTNSGFGQTKTWTGASGTDWETVNNWSPSGIPTSSDDIIIASAPSNQPSIFSGSVVLAKSVNIESGASVTFGNDQSALKIHGGNVFVTASNPFSGDGLIHFAGSGTMNIGRQGGGFVTVARIGVSSGDIAVASGTDLYVEGIGSSDETSIFISAGSNIDLADNNELVINAKGALDFEGSGDVGIGNINDNPVTSTIKFVSAGATFQINEVTALDFGTVTFWGNLEIGEGGDDVNINPVDESLASKVNVLRITGNLTNNSGDGEVIFGSGVHGVLMFSETISPQTFSGHFMTAGHLYLDNSGGLTIDIDINITGSATAFSTVLEINNGDIQLNSSFILAPSLTENDVYSSGGKFTGSGSFNVNSEIDLASDLIVETDASFSEVNMNKHSVYLKGETLKFKADFNFGSPTTSSVMQLYGSNNQTITIQPSFIYFPPLELAKSGGSTDITALNPVSVFLNSSNADEISLLFPATDIDGNSITNANKLNISSDVRFTIGNVLDKSGQLAFITGDGAVTLNGVEIGFDDFKHLKLTDFVTTSMTVDGNDGTFELSGADADQFSLDLTSVVLSFETTSIGTKNAFISSYASGTGSPDFGFRVKGTASGAEIEVDNFTDNSDVFHKVTIVDFGGVVQGNSEKIKFKIKNTGTADLTVSNITSSETAFGIDNISATITAGSIDFFTVTFTPSSLGFFTAFITIYNDAINIPEFIYEVRGTGIIPDLIVTDPTDIVDGGGNATEKNTLRWTIEQANALGGDQEITFNLPTNTTIFISAPLGIYGTDIVINGGTSGVILDGTEANSDCGLSIDDAGARIYGLTFQNFTTAICVYAEDCFITGNIIQNNQTGVIADGGGKYIELSNNTIQDTNTGVYFLGIEESFIEFSTIQNCQIGVHFEESYVVDVLGSLIKDNATTGIYLDGVEDSYLKNSIIQNSNKGIYASNSGFIEILGNTIENNATAGIYFETVYETLIGNENNPSEDYDYENQITGNGYGIYWEIGEGFRLINNIIENNTKSGIYLTDLSFYDDWIGNNKILNNGEHGIYFKDYTYSGGTRAEIGYSSDIVEYNTITNNSLDGVHVLNSDDLTFGYNEVANNRNGFRLENVNYSDIGIEAEDGGNDIHHNTQYGIRLISGTENTFLKNSIYCNNLGGIKTDDVSSVTPVPTITVSNNCEGIYGKASQAYTKIHVYYADKCYQNQGYTFIASVLTDENGDWKLPDSVVKNINLSSKLAFTATNDYNYLGTSQFVVAEYVKISQITNIEAHAVQTCAEAYYEVTFSISGTASGSYNIDYDNDGIYDETITFSGGKYTGQYNGQLIDNPAIKTGKLPVCASGGYEYTLDTKIDFKAPISIAKVEFEEPTQCKNPDGKMIISLNNYGSENYYNVDINANNLIDFSTVQVNATGQLILTGFAPETVFSNVRVYEIGTQCQAYEDDFSYFMTIPDYPKTDVEVTVNINEISPNYPVTLTIQNPEPNTTYELVKTHDFIDKTSFELQENGAYQLSLTSVSETVNFQVIGTRTETGCEGLLDTQPTVTVYSNVRAGELDILRLLYNKTGGIDWSTQWKFTGNPEDLPGVKIFAGHVLEIDVEGYGLIDKIPIQITQLPNLSEFNVNENSLTFESLEDLTGQGFAFYYDNQTLINDYVEIEIMEGENLFMSVVTEGDNNIYEWYKDGELLADYQEFTISINQSQLTDEGIYYALVKNTKAPNLILQRRNIKVTVFPIPDELDLSLLKIFYEATGGDATWKTKWDFENKDVFRWHGITMEDKKILEISLPNNNLVGFMPAEVFTRTGIFSDLIRINLPNNKLQGTIPETLSVLDDLTFLDLSNNQYSGQVPFVIGQIPNLESLILSHNSFTGFKTNFELNKLKIKYLQLNNNQFKSLPDFIGSLENVQVLNLGNNKFSELPDSFENLKNLYSVVLSQNKLQVLPQYFADFTKLKNLYLVENQLSDLPEGLEKLDLNLLAVYNNFLTHDDLEIYVQNFKNRKNSKIHYSPQAKFGDEKELVFKAGSGFTFGLETGGTSNQYQWYKDGNLITESYGKKATLSIGRLSNEDAGVYVLFVSNTINDELVLISRRIKILVECGQKIETKIITEGQTQLCQDEQPNVVLTATNIPPDHQLHWLRNGVKITNADGNTWTATEAGIYGLLLTDKNGCSAEAINRIPIIENYESGLHIEYQEDVLTLSHEYDNITFYQWYLNNEKIEVNTIGFVPTKDGEYYLEVINDVGCVGYSETVRITATGLEKLDNQADFKLFPNPTENMIQLQAYRLGNGMANVVILDVSGRVVFDKHFQTNGNLEQQINLEQLPTGVYILKLVGESETYIRKVIRK